MSVIVVQACELDRGFADAYAARSKSHPQHRSEPPRCRANCLFMLGDTNGAIRDFRLAVQVSRTARAPHCSQYICSIQANPSSSESYYNLGNAEYTLGHWQVTVHPLLSAAW